jgi:hypothetical protein
MFTKRVLAKIAKDAKLLLAILSFFFLDYYIFSYSIPCIMKILRITNFATLRLGERKFGIMFIKF